MIKNFIFDLQRFATQSIAQGETQTLDGVTYTALEDSQLNLDDGKVSGITSGKVEAVITGKTDPTITFDATDGAFNFTAAVEDDSLNVGYNNVKIHYTGGSVTYTANSIEIPAGEVSVVGTGDIPINATINFPKAATATFADGVISANVSNVSGAVSVYGMQLGTVSIDGELSFNQTTREVNFAKGATIDVNLPILNDYTIFLTALDKVGGIFAFSKDPMGVKFTPNSGDGALGIVLKEGGETNFDGEINCRAGSLIFGLDGGLRVTDGTIMDVTIGGMTATLKTTGEDSAKIGLNDGKITLTPGTDGAMEISVDFIDIAGKFSLKSGSVTFDPSTKEITLAKDTQLQIDFGNEYLVDIKALDVAGGVIAINSNSITFTPNSGDGNLELTITKGDQTRSATLDVTGTVTYNLDGSISLAKGTVVKNVFEDGNILTITANTAASGSIVFSPDSGLTIEPSTTDALEVTLTTGNVDIVNITSIDGTINYSGGLITASDGTKAHIKYYFDWESELSTSGGTASIRFTDDRTVYTANEGANFVIKYSDGETIEIQNGSFSDIYENDEHEAMELITEGSILKTNDIDFVTTLEKAGNYTLNGMNVTTTEDMVEVQLSGNYDTIIVNGISYTPLDEDVTLTIDDGVATVSGGKVSVIMEDTDIPLEVDTTDGAMTFDGTTKKFTFAEGAVLSLQTGSSELQFVTKKEFSIGVEKTADDKVSFNIDGTAQLEIVNGTRTTTLDFTGGLVYESGGKISLENGTQINLTWEDGNSLKLTSHGSNGSIELDAEKGVRITSDDEKLDMTLTTAEGYSTTISSIKGSLWYKSGTVTLDADTFITGKNTVEGHELGIKFEAIGGTGSLKFENAGFTYSAGTGKNKVTYTLGNAVSSFTVNKGSVFIQNRVFHISKGSDVSTDFKDFIPAQYFETGKPGTYTINGQTIKTSAANLKLTATDDYMAFKTSDDVVEYDGMTFAGNGNVSLKPDIVVLGKDVVATGFSEGNSFMLAEAGNVTADAKVFELTEQENKLGENIPLNVSVEGAQDGFIFSRTITRESEDYFDDPDYDNVGKIFTEKFIVHNDETYRTRTDPLGLQEVIGISGGASIEGGAILGDEVSPSYYDLVTDTNGSFTIGENTYKIADDTEVGVVLHAAFEDGLSYASAVKNLNGTISGNFSDGGFAVNGNDSVNVYGDTDISIVGSGKEYEILGLDDGASLKVSATGTYEVNGKEIVARAGDVIVGTSDGEAEIYYANTISNTVNNTLITGTENSDFIFNSGTGVTIQALGSNDYIENNVDSSLDAASLANSIDAGDGNDVIYSYHTYNPTLLGGDGDDSIAVESGHKTFADGGAGNDKIIGVSQEGGWGMGDYATILGGDGDDYIDPIYSKEASINGGDGNDTIRVNGENATVDGGAGNNLIISTDTEGGVKGKNIVLNGKTTVENFNTGFGEGSDTIYIHTENDPAGVEFLEDGLTFGNSTASLTLSDVTTTAKVNLFHENRDVLNKGVFIAAGEWYKAEDSDFTVDAGEEVYFVGTAAKPSAGLDFSDISSDLNVTMNTAYIDSEDYVEGTPFWVNGIYSLKGGAGNTTITGSTEDDTIITGSGDTTINAAGGDDLISLTGGAALINYTAGDGNDTIYGFNSNATLSPDSVYTTQVSGNDLIITVGESKITLVDAANLSDPNIESTNEAVNLIEILLKRTALGYPIASGVLLNPEEFIGEEPTNYSAKEEWTITSADNLKLYGVHYTPENSNDKWVVLVHGYGLKHESMYPFTYFYLANGYNVLMIDQRAAGNSEGTWLTMGAAESQDVALWTQEIARRNSNAKITLHGVSMGAATAMLAASREDAVNVTSLIEDCGYTDTIKLFYVLNEVLKEFDIGAEPEVVAALDSVGYGMMGYYLHDASPINSISSAKMPTLFIHGDDDGVVPVSMVSELYDESGAEVKEKFIVKGAGHAQSGLNDLDGYSNTVFRFIAEANGEGWVTTNTTDNISLRGTKYDDTITNSGDDVTINGGKGDDLISLSSDAKDNVIEYTQGDGNDTIYGFNSTDMLSISGAPFTAHKSGDDIIVSVGEENITLADAASLSSALDIVNGKGVTSDLIINSTNNTLVTGTDEDDHIINSGTTVTIQGYGGDDYIENNVDSSLTAASLGNSIDAGDGNDTIYNYHTYNPTLLGGAGNDSIVVTRGHLTYVDGGEGNDTILGKKDSGGWDMGGYATVLGGEGNDYIDTGYTNSASIDGGAGNDSIYASGNRITINGGEGKNLIKVSPSTLDADNECAYIVLNGTTSVEGFKTGFGNGSDTVYIEDEDPGVDFKKEGLSLYDNDAEKSLTFSDINTTAKLNLYYSNIDWLRKSIFIADDDWYKVSDSDLSVSSGEGVYFVGATAKLNHGVDFSGVTTDLNVTINTEYEAENNFVWVNNVHSIKGGAGLTTIAGSEKNDTIITGSGDTTINVAGGDDLISLSSGAALIEYTVGDGNESIYNFNGNSTLSISGGKYSLETQDDKSILHIGDEAITIFGANNGNIIGERFIPVEELKEVYGDKLTVASGSVELGDDGAAVAVYEEDSAVYIVGGAGNDTLIALGSAPITFDMSAGGADKIPLLMANQNVTMIGYDAKQGGGITTGNPNIASMVEEIMAGKDTRFGNGKVSLKTSEETQSVFTLAENTSPKGSAIINFFDAHNRILPVGFTNSNGGTLDVSNSDADYLLLGNYFGEKNGGSTLIGGSGDDTLLGGAGDLLDAAGGYNEIYLAGGGAQVGLDNGGRTSVHNFQTGFDGDALYSKGDIAARIRFDGENITASVDGGAQVKLESVASGADFAEILMYEGEEETKIAVAKPGSTIKSYSADIYLGRENAAVDFSGMTDDLLVNLSNEPVVTGSDQKQFFGINQVTAGDGNSTLIGTSGNETLIAGKGNTSIYGGAGYDSLVGNTDKTGSTTFFFEPGDGRDIIDNFDFAADKIDIGNNVIKDASISRGKVFVDFDDGSRLIIRDAVGKNFQIGDMIAKVDTNISYDGLADCYVATGGSSLKVDSNVENAEIWLDNSHDTQFIGNIRTLDASAVKGNTSLVGNDFNNTIIAGQGDSSLWGGWSPSDDVLIGGAAHNEFYYEVGNGRDTIQSANDGDVINLGASLDQISFDNTQITSSGVVVQFTDGGSLTVDGTAEVIFALDDGTRTKVNHQTQQFE